MAVQLKRVSANKFQAPKGCEITVSVRSQTGAITLASASYPDGAPPLPLDGGNATFTVQSGEHILSVSGTPVYPWELWWVVEVDAGVDSPPLEYGSGFAGGQFNLTMSINGV